ncbi:MltA domain-containing protein [Thalassotalea euphylliae]|uniref:Acetate--CoA ligase n=1 Tax=Thalassotalea euphylliae TaxID=1655234 RepID=A0A3E0UL35_9GAMM|nr:MltA domain-containing protein [Thalassotalea euphylliae]REL36985.1 acetate--CoA ligase [Thalassotalea euphylliae]
MKNLLRILCSSAYAAIAIAFVTSVFIASSVKVFAAASFEVDHQPDFGQLKGFKGSELCIVADNTQQYIVQNPDDEKAVHHGAVIGNNVSLERVNETLAFLCETYRSDVRAGRPSRLHDNAFVKANFDFVRWYPDKPTATKIASSSTNEVKSRLLNNIPERQLFLTKYYAKLLDGSSVQTATFDQALYQLPFDEKGLSKQAAELKKEQLTRYKYTRQEVIKGALLAGKLAKPLVWMTEEALHDVLLQGTGVLQVDGNTRYFNVHRNNGIAYDYHIGKREQARYWYFAEVPSILGYGQDLPNKIAIKPQVSLAGNVRQLGLGKLMLLNYKVRDNTTQSVNSEGTNSEARLAILADEGGAFDNNLFQLDLLAGSYRGWQDYYAANKHLPDYADVWILLKKTNK